MNKGVKLVGYEIFKENLDAKKYIEILQKHLKNNQNIKGLITFNINMIILLCIAVRKSVNGLNKIRSR